MRATHLKLGLTAAAPPWTATVRTRTAIAAVDVCASGIENLVDRVCTRGKIAAVFDQLRLCMRRLASGAVSDRGGYRTASGTSGGGVEDEKT
jgi:phage tail sheath protein FI